MTRSAPHALGRTATAVAMVLALTSCGGSPNTPGGPVVNSPGGPTSPPSQQVLAGVSIAIPLASGARRLRGAYVSTATQSIVIGIASSDGGPVNGITASTIDTVATGSNCSKNATQVICRGTVAAVAGSDVFNVTTFAWPGGTGPILSAGQVSAAVSGSGGGVSVGALSLALEGVVSKLRVTVTPSSAHVGVASSAQVALTAYDAGGAAIVGSSSYQVPVQLSIQGDAAGAFSLRSDNATGSSIAVTKPTTAIVLRYDGNAQAASIALQATLAGGGAGAPSATAAFALRGVAPPPKAGDIFVLNRGANQGAGATVTVYDPAAAGNATPKRTLQLSSSLYAQAIAVDASGKLYVGYLDSPQGFSPGSGTPDAGNLIAVFAPGASGAAHPVATIAADPTTTTTIFPISLAFDPQGDVVTFGATALHVAGGTAAVMTYPAGTDGAQPPSHAFNFSSPYVHYAGPTGLAVDDKGNVYVNGTLKTSLGTAYGIYVAAAADRDNPAATATRVVPWDPTTALVPGQVSNIALDRSGEVYVANFAAATAGSGTTCTPAVNAYAAGSSGGTTDDPPLRIASIAALATTNAECVKFGDPLAAVYPAISVFSSFAYVTSDFSNALAVFQTGAAGKVVPKQIIAGSATGLDVPVAVAVAPATQTASQHQMSGRAPARPAATLVH